MEHITEQEVLLCLNDALKNGEFFIVLQPQYSHSTGLLVGAEALVRWKNDKFGIIPPNDFIPVLEKHNIISELDLYVFEKTCAFLKHCKEERYALVPISVNLSRCDIFNESFLNRLEAIRKKYDVNPKHIPLELTESAAMIDTLVVQDFISKIHNLGYKVEMDDFGSGYSSLNVLKDVSFDLIKLDMKFLQGDLENGRAGIIVSSVVRMVNWLGLPIIAEGVETVAQADYLLSLGCEYIQGYLYSKPLPVAEYEEIFKKGNISTIVPHLKLINTLNASTFWTPESLDTLIFSNYTGGAAIFDYTDGKTEVLRVNQKFLKELGMNLAEKDITYHDLLEHLKTEGDVEIFKDMLKKAVETGEEQESEAWWELHSQCCGDETLCIRSNVRMIGEEKNTQLFYITIRNITAEKNRFNEILTSEKRFKMASEQVNIYYWEYTVATKEMRPCFRCMRDLGLPALVTNYPEPAIEMGIFPPEVADMYRDWHRQIAAGVKSLEAVIPLTAGRVPFLVRYTTEFDEFGKPVKAYGSAALVVDNK